MDSKEMKPVVTSLRLRSGAKELRDGSIIAAAMAGQSVTSIAESFGLARQTVSKILNSDEVKERVREIDAKLAECIPDAVATVIKHVKFDYGAARDLLRHFGSMRARQEVDIGHRLSLEEIIAGANEDDGGYLDGSNSGICIHGVEQRGGRILPIESAQEPSGVSEAAVRDELPSE